MEQKQLNEMLERMEQLAWEYGIDFGTNVVEGNLQLHFGLYKQEDGNYTSEDK